MRVDRARKGRCRHQRASQPTWAEVNAFAYPAAFSPGNSGRNILTGPGNLWHQVSVSKSFAVTEQVRAFLRYDINNPFKYYFFNPPTNSVDFRNPEQFGKITGNQGSFS